MNKREAARYIGLVLADKDREHGYGPPTELRFGIRVSEMLDANPFLAKAFDAGGEYVGKFNRFMKACRVAYDRHAMRKTHKTYQYVEEKVGQGSLIYRHRLNWASDEGYTGESDGPELCETVPHGAQPIDLKSLDWEPVNAYAEVIGAWFTDE